MGDEFRDEWRIKTAERLASIERSVKYIETHLTAIPKDLSAQSESIEKLGSRISKLEGYVKVRVAYISGIAAAIMTAIPYAYEWLKTSLRG